MQSDFPSQVQRKIQKLCDDFQRQLRNGERPPIESFLEGWTGDESVFLRTRLETIQDDLNASFSVGGEEFTRSQLDVTSDLDDDNRHKPAGNAPTVTADSRPVKPLSGSGNRSGAGARFMPGQLLADRYRIVSMLGRGGMGEVYRAEDIRLGHTVALKFLPVERAGNQRHLEYLYKEVRLSQRLTNPHICRVHDLVEVDGQHCLSMEYIEGEDLKSLLRRVGPLPEPKALELAHQICDGLHAAHQVGVLHRDLKSANVMIDERGRARIADFGLAREKNLIDPNEGLTGSPNYMAPEQMARNETSVQSDLFSLGLILFEVLTGKPAHNGTSRDEIGRMHQRDEAEQAILKRNDISPAIVTAIATCLRRKPEDRPSSVAAFAETLPGRLSLSDAFRSGEMASPNMIAEVRSRNSTIDRHRIGWIMAACISVLIAVAYFSTTFQQFGIDRSLTSLADDASEYRELLGWPAGTSNVYRYVANRPAMRWFSNNAAAPDQHESGNRSYSAYESSYFWYRESPTPLIALLPYWKGDGFLVVDEVRPSILAPDGMHMRLDAQGNLKYYSAIPSTEFFSSQDSSAPDVEDTEFEDAEGNPWWHQPLELAGLSPSQISRLQPIPPEFTPLGFANERRSWILPKTDDELSSRVNSAASIDNANTDTPIAARIEQMVRIDAARADDTVTYFRIVMPWDDASPVIPWNGFASRNRVLAILIITWIPVLLGLIVWQVRKNLYAKRADRLGAIRLAGFGAFTVIMIWLLGGTHAVDALEMDTLVTALAGACLVYVVMWLAYIAFEPVVRRHWPTSLVSWSRLLHGNWNDSLVGRDVLIGCTVGALAAISKHLIFDLPSLWGDATFGLPNVTNLTPLHGLRIAVGEVTTAASQAIVYSIFFQLFFLIALRVLTGRTAVAAPIFVAVLSTMVAAQYEPAWLAFVVTAIEMSVMAYLYLRVGLLAAVTMHFVRLMRKWPMANDISSWYIETTGISLCVIALLIALAIYAGRPQRLSSADAAY
ncbi:Serine/threonine-protein kinase PknH [Rubripirellula tenax]|uniref:Serine/threonine-protein kinase PknH n=1 Tax=Rubripirellula tenax TaxID=2528015 RepID=A0A5C6ESP9_9BACT|nr:serine/threonine-protein kinase [Rubripirellula tenax]TWU50489.1 Serine/threonine-protein kinase PknH [Rubripirellula tenax]